MSLYPNGPSSLLGNGYEEERGPEPNDRAVFMYMAPPEGYAYKDSFAQCGPCRMRAGNRCVILGSKETISPEIGSCGEFAMWATPDGSPDAATVRTHEEELDKGIEGKTTKEMVGYVERKVRCENCYFGEDGATECDWYEKLTQAFPRLFQDNAKIEPYACCNAQTAKEDE